MFIYSRAKAFFAALAPPRGRSIPVEYFVLAGVSFEGENVSMVDGRPVSEFVVDQDGKRYRFCGVARDIPVADMTCSRSGKANGSSNQAWSIAPSPEPGCAGWSKNIELSPR